MGTTLPREAVDALRLFNEKAEKLLTSSFARYVLENRTSFSLSAAVDKPLTTNICIPDQDVIDAFVLTLRFFCQDNEPTSLRKTAAIYEMEAVPEDARERFQDARRKFNDYLDSSSAVTIDEQVITHRRLWDVFLYGELAHSNPEKKSVYDYWMSRGPIAAFLNYKFSVILTEWLRVVHYVRQLNSAVLNELGLV